MPDTRKHRGAHPKDADLFHPKWWPVLRNAVADMSWLLTRGYSERAALKLVGDRYSLVDRQRLAVQRSSCSDQALRHRQVNEVHPAMLRDQTLWIDGFNVLTTIEAALAGGVLLRGRDGCIRDLAGMHGTYRKVQETSPALQLIGRCLHDQLNVAELVWCLDRPVSNSGRLAVLIRQLGRQSGWPWSVVLSDRADAELRTRPEIVGTSDSGILDFRGPWFAVTREVLARMQPHVSIVPLDAVGVNNENSMNASATAPYGE